ncbi:single-stranded-DNA-specific exonuclease RecJ [Gallaecimonas sp. GXIMD4217]|uniref:single-stranded-DNA-specific exonuclease RecJ n=1 Tax=Gallaecimonas sp. GXIMD4217 TaxID=3131927 RepID=UPI00311ABC38
MTQTKIVRRPAGDESGLPDSLPPLLRRLYAARGLKCESELDKSVTALAPYGAMKGIAEAVRLLADAIGQHKRILVVGDFDADGATSSALSVLALRMLGAAHADFLVPNRFEYGYGLSPEIVQVAAERGCDLLMTVDNGISSLSGVEAAKAAGMQVLITDHHLPGEQLPAADAIVNPNLPDCGFPSKALAGVGVAFYLMLAVRTELRDRGAFAGKPPNLAELLDIVALGTVADVVPLDANNRILVHQGLARIRAGRCRPGILALCEVAGRNPARMVASDLGFALGPRLNAAGRLDDMSVGVSLLITDDLHQARLMAAQLDMFNKERREIEAGMQAEALQELKAIELGEVPSGIALYRPDWHQGVIGILAARIKERYHRPVIAFAQGSEGELKGSARSIPGLHMRDLLDELDTKHPGLILKFGGHAMAAGLSIREGDFGRFAELYAETVDRVMTPELLEGKILSDGELAAHELCLETAQQIRGGGPWGQAFPEPMFDGHFQIVQQRLVGQKHLKLVLAVDGSDQYIDGICFNVDTDFWPNSAVQWVRLAYRLDVNEFRGKLSPQLMIEHLEPA